MTWGRKYHICPTQAKTKLRRVKTNRRCAKTNLRRTLTNLRRAKTNLRRAKTKKNGLRRVDYNSRVLVHFFLACDRFNPRYARFLSLTYDYSCARLKLLGLISSLTPRVSLALSQASLAGYLPSCSGDSSGAFSRARHWSVPSSCTAAHRRPLCTAS